MKTFQVKIFSRISLSLLMLLSVGFLGSFSFTSALAQSTTLPATLNLCLDPQGPNLQKAAADKSCPVGYVLRENFRTLYKGVCVVKPNDDQNEPWDITLPEGADYEFSDANATACKTKSPPIITYPFVTFASMSQYGTPPGGGTNSNSNTGTNSNTGSGGVKPVPSVPQVPCGDEKGFHMVGPLCVPNSPFSKGLAGDPSSQTAAGLAAKIIKILLYFAGIVAVIMCIIGGYQIMTAAGNAVQATNGRKTLTNAIIGLVIVILSYVVVQAVISFVTK